MNFIKPFVLFILVPGISILFSTGFFLKKKPNDLQIAAIFYTTFVIGVILCGFFLGEKH